MNKTPDYPDEKLADEIESELQIDRIEAKVDQILATMTRVEQMTSTVIAEVKPTLDELMNSSLIKMLGVGKKK